MTEYEAWVIQCEKIGTEIWRLEKSESPQSGLFKTQKWFMFENREYGTEPIYHVWVNGVRVYCGENYYDAYKMYGDALLSKKINKK